MWFSRGRGVTLEDEEDIVYRAPPWRNHLPDAPIFYPGIIKSTFKAEGIKIHSIRVN